MIPSKFLIFMQILIITLAPMLLLAFQNDNEFLAESENVTSKTVAKLGPKLQIIYSLHSIFQTDKNLLKSLTFCALNSPNEEPTVHCVARIIGDVNSIVKNGVKIGSQFNDIITADVPLSALEQFVALPNVLHVEVSRPVKLDLDKSMPAVKGDIVQKRDNDKFTGYTGKGVIIGIIDSGIDFTHPDFINPDGNSRILYIWDQTDTDGPTPTKFNYGTEWNQADINDEIDGSPMGLVRQVDNNGHGTHIAAIAAGNGRATGNNFPANRYIGMAPEADLIIVKSNLQTSSIIDGLDYIQSQANETGKPCVINNSYSSQYGPHDGTRDWELAFDNATGPGKVLVISAGNNGNHHNLSPTPPPPAEYNTRNHIHAQGIAIEGYPLEINFEVPDYTPDPGILNDDFELDMWYQGEDKITVKITTPNGYSHTKSTKESYTEKQTDDGTIWINNASSGPDFNNGDNECYIYVADKFENNPPAKGSWKITITGIDLPAGGSFDIWASYNTLISDPYGIIFHNYVTNELLVGSPGTATKPITVGAYTTKNGWTDQSGQLQNMPYNQVIHDIAWYSSPGPRRDGLLKPEIIAPGSNIASARSIDCNISSEFITEDGVHAIMQGTSRAAAHVTGAVALLLQHNPALSNDEVKNILTESAVTDAFTGNGPNYIWGYGKLDIYAAMLGAGGAVPVELSSFTALAERDDVILRWITASETNNYGFEIQRSNHNQYEFKKVGFVTGIGTTNNTYSYEFIDKDLPANHYHYRLKQIDTDGTVKLSSIISVTVTNPVIIHLYPNYPNPFNTDTIISYDIPVTGHVKLKVLNISGEEVKKLIDKEQPAGYHSIRFDASHLSSGVYFYCLNVNNITFVKKMIYIQ